MSIDKLPHILRDDENHDDFSSFLLPILQVNCNNASNIFIFCSFQRSLVILVLYFCCTSSETCLKENIHQSTSTHSDINNLNFIDNGIRHVTYIYHTEGQMVICDLCVCCWYSERGNANPAIMILLNEISLKNFDSGNFRTKHLLVVNNVAQHKNVHDWSRGRPISIFVKLPIPNVTFKAYNITVL